MLAQGKYIALLDDDDYYLTDNRLQQIVDFLEHNPDYGVVHTSYVAQNVLSGKTKKISVTQPENGDLQTNLWNGKYKMCYPSSVICKSLLDKYVCLNDYIKYDFPIQDWQTFILLAPYTKFKYLDNHSYFYRITPDSMSRPASYEKLKNKYIKEGNIVKYLCEKFPDKYTWDEALWQRNINDLLLSLAFRKMDYKKARIYRQKSTKNKHYKLSGNLFTFYAFCLLKRLFG